MKLASRAVSPLDNLSEIVLPCIDEYPSNNNRQAQNKLVDDVEISIFWDTVRKDASSRTKVLGAAHLNRAEREFFAHFGILKQVMMNRYSHIPAPTSLTTKFAA